MRLLNEHNITLEHVASRGIHPHHDTPCEIPVGRYLAGRAALDRDTVIIPDLQAADAVSKLPPCLQMQGLVGYCAVPLLVKGQVKGVLEIFHRQPLDRNRDWHDFLAMLAGQTAIAVDNAHLFTGLERSNTELTLAYDTTLERWARTLELRDLETEGHARRVTELIVRLARRMGVDDEDLVHTRRGALLHDIGMLGIPDTILFKPGPLTDEEWEVIHLHPVHAYELLSPIKFLRPALEIPYAHHEKWDGTGYPRRLTGKQILLEARIFAVVDVWDSLRSDRPYRAPWSTDTALGYIQEQAGRHFDPNVVDHFLALVPDEEQST